MRSAHPFPTTRHLILLLTLFLFAASCSSETQDRADTISPDPLVLSIPQLYSTVTSIVVQVAYEPDAEPYTGSIQDEIPYWWILQSNIDALFFGRDVRPALYVPWGLEGMDPIPEQDRTAWTSSEIIALARSLWDTPMTSSTAYIHVLYLNGYYEDNGSMNIKVLGLSFAGSSLITIFKDVIVDTSSSTTISRFVEQATLVHEAGHILGLVDNGLPMVADHLDPDHPGHCTSQDCVMYWLNEGPADLRDFVQQVMDTGSLVMFGDECLDDAWYYEP